MLSDVLDQIEARGEARGIMKERKKIKDIAKELLRRGMPKEDVANIVHLDIKELEEF